MADYSVESFLISQNQKQRYQTSQSQRTQTIQWTNQNSKRKRGRRQAREKSTRAIKYKWGRKPLNAKVNLKPVLKLQTYKAHTKIFFVTELYLERYLFSRCSSNSSHEVIGDKRSDHNRPLTRWNVVDGISIEVDWY